MSLQKIKAGERFRPSATAWNAFVDAALAHQAAATGGGALTLRNQQTGIVKIRNDSGADRDRFDILGIDGPLITPGDNLDEFQSRVLLKGVTPVNPDHVGKFAVLLEPIPNGKIGRAVVAGVTVCAVDVQDEADEFADIAGGVTDGLVSGSTGAAKILSKEAGTGSKWAQVRIGAGGGGGGGAGSEIVRLTTVTPNSAGYYAGKIQVYDVAANVWTDGDDVWVINAVP